jgi:hypothetical protein
MGKRARVGLCSPSLLSLLFMDIEPHTGDAVMRMGLHWSY